MKLKIKVIMITISMIFKLTKQDDLSNNLRPNEDNIGRKGQAVTNPSGDIIPNAVLNFPVVSNIAFYPGNSEKADNCERDEVVVGPGTTCQKLLQRGSCRFDEFVLLDPEYQSGYCAPRLCPPDRIFVHGTQQCHAPVDGKICPYGKELFYTSYGTAICDCPEGTVIGYNNKGVEACLPILSQNQFCPKTQVQWFRDYASPSECLPDPCQGKNLNRKANRFPFAPNEPGQQCYQLGQTDGVCKSGLIYALNLPSLKGRCSSLQKLGYEVLTQREVFALNQNYGTNIVNKKVPFSTLKHDSVITLGEIDAPLQSFNNHIKGGVIPEKVNDESSTFIFNYLQRLGILNPQVQKGSVTEQLSLTTGNVLLKPYSHNFRSHGNEDSNNNTSSKSLGDLQLKSHVLSRKKRQDSPTTAMPTKLVNCKPGAQRDVNGKCKEATIGPGSGSSGASSSPTPSCPSGQSFNVKRMCVSGASSDSSFG